MKRFAGQSLKRQQGVIVVLVTIAMFSILAMGALALDGGHMLLNKTRLQHAVDAAALSAGITVDQGLGHTQAKQDGITTLRSVLGEADFAELEDAIELSTPNFGATDVTPQIRIEFSFEPDPFIPSTDPDAQYVRVTLSDVNLASFLAQVVNFDKFVSASAVAGASTPTIDCNNKLVPMMVCECEGADCPYDSSDPTAGAFGYPYGQVMAMKIGSKQSSPIGPGNFQLIRLGDNTGANDLRHAMAGTPSDNPVCFEPGPDGQVPTEPGNTVGPVAQGLNTRMGKWKGPVNQVDHPRDFNVCEGDQLEVTADNVVVGSDGLPVNESDAADPTAPALTTDDPYRYSEYLSNATNTADGASCIAPAADPLNVPGRRELAIVVAKCDGSTNGQNTLEFVGLACFYLMQEVIQKGNEAFVIGEFYDKCTSAGYITPAGTDNNGPYKIVLYRNPASTDS